MRVRMPRNTLNGKIRPMVSMFHYWKRPRLSIGQACKKESFAQRLTISCRLDSSCSFCFLIAYSLTKRPESKSPSRVGVEPAKRHVTRGVEGIEMQYLHFVIRTVWGGSRGQSWCAHTFWTLTYDSLRFIYMSPKEIFDNFRRIHNYS